MKLSAGREALLKPLQAVIGVVERRQTMPILANVLLVAQEGQLSITATDLEVELVASGEAEVETAGEVTVPGRKLLDICRALPEGAVVAISQSGEKVVLRSGRSKFTLTTLPAAEFPTVEDINADEALELPQSTVQRLLEKTHFSMAQQDVRYYLNGLLLETDAQYLRAVATDGHRLALVESDGILIVQVAGNAGPSDPLLGDMSAAGVEFSRILGEIDKASGALGGGAVSETVVTLARFTLIFHPVDDDVMLVMALEPDGNLGKARYLIRRSLMAIRQEL